MFPNNYGDPIADYGFSYAIRLGEIPYKDFNIITTPLYPFIMSIGLFIWNNYIMFLLEQTLLVTIMFVLLHKIYGKRVFALLFLICATVAIGILPTYNFFVMFLLVLLLFLEKKYSKKDLLIGIVIGLAILTKHTIGVLFIIPSFVFYYKDFKRLFKRGLGCFIVVMLFLLYLLITNSFSSFLDLCVFGLFDFTGHNGKLFNFWFFLGLISFIISIIITIKNKKDISNYYLLCSIFYLIPLFDMVHYFCYVICFGIQILPLIDLDDVKIVRVGYFLSFVIACFYGFMYFKLLSPVLSKNVSRFEYLLNSKDSYKATIDYFNYFDKYDNPLIISYSKMQYDISRNNKIDYFDVILYGNFGYDGSNKMINKIEKMHDKYIIVDMNIYNSKETNSQFDKTIAKHVIDNYELVESKYIFNVYYKE